VVRTYVNKNTGVSMTALVAFGPAEKLVSHTPTVCYPAVGYASEAQSADRTFQVGGESAVLRTSLFAKTNERVEVAFGFYHDGRWSPDALASRKKFRHRPGMLKVQVQRQLGPSEKIDQNDPMDEFLTLLLQELDRSQIVRR
jgi:hypothetical protein